MTKKIFAISLLIIISMIILPLLSFHGSPTEVKEEQEKRQQQHFAYATATVGTASSSSFTSSFLPTTDFNFAAVGDWGCTDDTSFTVKQIQNKEPELEEEKYM
jgi:hypothetical protein